MSSGHQSLDHQRWAELKALFSAAVERPPEEWPPLVAGLRERDPELADQLQRLLDGHLETLIPVQTIGVKLLPAGATLGPYVIAGLIGEGGMGQVYRAKDERLGREVAIKVLPPGLSHDPDRRVRMEREARAMGMLNHPNIVTVHDIGDHQGSPFIVSELLEGQTLRQRVSDSSASRLSASASVEIVASVAGALGAAHRRGIVHRDIKPENIFLTSDGRTKVLDFGIAKLVDGEAAADGTAVGTMVGTLGYMSPEQLRGEPPCAQTDVYACGVVLYELLSGARPYAGRSQAAIIGAILHEPPPPLPDVAPSLAALTARCLDKRKDARFADGADLAAALRTSSAVDARTVPLPSAAARHRRPDLAANRRRTLVVPALAVAGVVAGGLGWWSLGNGASPAPLPQVATADIALPAPAPPTSASMPVEPVRESPSTPTLPASGTPLPRENRSAPPAATSAEAPQGQAAASPDAPVSPPSPVVPPLDGVWTVSEQIAEDAHAIACTSAGALQLRFNDGLLDGTLRLKRDCTDVKRGTTDSTETTSALAVGTSTGDAVSFVTRVVEEGLATTCRYSGQIVGTSRGTMAGEVACEARSAGLSAVLALRGTWRASRIEP